MADKDYKINKARKLLTAAENAVDYYGMMILKKHKEIGVPWMVVSHGKVLIYLYRNGEKTMSEITESIGKTAPTTTTLVRRLKKEGMVTSKKVKGDNRKSCISITEKGRVHCVNMREYLDEVMSAYNEGFDDGEIEKATEIFDKLMYNIKKFEAERQ